VEAKGYDHVGPAVKYCDACHGTFPNEPDRCPRDRTALRFVTELAPPMTIRDKYQIVEKVGAGGMAVVFKARHLAFAEVFALKVVSPVLADNEEFLKRFKNEAIITRRLRHPNAVRVDDLDVTDDGRPFIVMEYVEGETLRKVLQDQGAMPVPRALSIARQCAEALAAAHELGIVHRDIKPDNILLVVQPDGTDVVKILDFGIAKVREGTMQLTDGYSPTQTGMIVGTPQYISPEQALGMRGDDIDGRADLYSLGVVLFEMLTAELPFHSDTPMGMMLHHIQTPARSPRELRPDAAIPQTLSDVLLKMLAKDPGRRFQTAGELAQALGRPHDAGMTGLHQKAKVPAVAANPAASTAARPVRPVARSGPPQNPFRRPEPPPVEPLDIGGGESLALNRTVLSVGAVALLGLGLAMLWPSAPARPAGPRRTIAPPGAPAPPAVPTAEVGARVEGATVDDAQILAEVTKRFSDNEDLRDAQLEAAVDKGVVTLTGRASASQSDVAVGLARTVSGVSLVKVGISTESATPVAAPTEVVDPQVRELTDEGNALLDRGHAQEALMKFNAALELHPGYPTARLGVERARAKLAAR
jgi:serine/threonine protein kinase